MASGSFYPCKSRQQEQFWQKQRCLLLSLLLSLLLGLLVMSFEMSDALAQSDLHRRLQGNETWSSFAGVASGGQFSALADINVANVSKLERAWVVHTGDVVAGPAAEGGTSFQATPLIWNDSLYVCTPMHRVLALDAASGEERWSFDAWETVAAEIPRFGANCRGVALWVDDTADGIVRAFDARTGKLVWEFNPIPEALSAKTGGANTWSFMAVDEELQLVYLPTSSPSVDPYGVLRDEPIVHANAVVALNLATGEVVWSFQTVHHDLFDYDLPAQPILFDLQREGQSLPALAQITKTGFVFVLDRRTGKPLYPVEEVPVPSSTIANERASTTQPRPTRPAPFARQALSGDELFGVAFFDKLACEKHFEELRYEGLFTPPSEQGSLQFPSSLGGGNWGGAALDPRRNLLIVKTSNVASTVKLIPADAMQTRPVGPPVEFLKKPLNQTPYRLDGEFFLSPLGVPCTPPPWGELVAIDLNSAEHVWRQPLGRNPLGPLHTPASWGSPNVAGPIVTGGGLIFIGAGADSAFRALDLATGAELWADRDLPAPAMAVPMTYRVRGSQYVVVAAGGNGLAGTVQSDAIIAYRLAN